MSQGRDGVRNVRKKCHVFFERPLTLCCCCWWWSASSWHQQQQLLAGKQLWVWKNGTLGLDWELKAGMKINRINIFSLDQSWYATGKIEGWRVKIKKEKYSSLLLLFKHWRNLTLKILDFCLSPHFFSFFPLYISLTNISQTPRYT